MLRRPRDTEKLLKVSDLALRRREKRTRLKTSGEKLTCLLPQRPHVNAENPPARSCRFFFEGRKRFRQRAHVLPHNPKLSSESFIKFTTKPRSGFWGIPTWPLNVNDLVHSVNDFLSAKFHFLTNYGQKTCAFESSGSNSQFSSRPLILKVRQKLVMGNSMTTFSSEIINAGLAIINA